MTKKDTEEEDKNDEDERIIDVAQHEGKDNIGEGEYVIN